MNSIDRNEIKAPYLNAFECYSMHIERFMNEQIDAAVEARSRYNKSNSAYRNQMPCEHHTAEGFFMKHLRHSGNYRVSRSEVERIKSVESLRMARKLDAGFVSYMLD